MTTNNPIDTSGMSELERVLRTENGINIFLRKRLINAYESENGATELPQLIEEAAQRGTLISDELLPRLRELAADSCQ